MNSILITGCSSGIGHDAAHGLARRGWRVFATCRKPEDTARLAEEGLEALTLDVTDAGQIRDVLAEVTDRTGGTLDAVYSNAAFAIPGAVEDLPTDALRSGFETNLFGLHELNRQVIPIMRRQGHGRLVLCSSVLGFVAMPWRGAYVATKFALEGLSDTLRIEMQGSGIHVVLLQPGPITSRFRLNSIPHFERWIDWRGSARAADYARLKHRLYEGGTDRWELPASAVTAALTKALESPNPRARYRITVPTRMAAAGRTLLPGRLFDRLRRE